MEAWTTTLPLTQHMSSWHGSAHGFGNLTAQVFLVPLALQRSGTEGFYNKKINVYSP